MPLFIFLSKVAIANHPAFCMHRTSLRSSGLFTSVRAMLAAADGEKYYSTKMSCQKETGKFISILDMCSRF